MTREDIIKKRELYKNNITDRFGMNDIRYCVLCIYTMIPPLRTQDIINTYIFDDVSVEKEDITHKNYVDIKTKKLYRNHFKTKKSHDNTVIDLPNELMEVFVNFKKKSGTPFLLCTVVGKQYTGTNFSNLLNTTLDKKISSSKLRKIFIAEEVIDKGMDPKKKKEVASIMGHSPATQILKYSKHSKGLHSNHTELKKQIEELENQNKHLKACNPNSDISVSKENGLNNKENGLNNPGDIQLNSNVLSNNLDPKNDAISIKDLNSNSNKEEKTNSSNTSSLINSLKAQIDELKKINGSVITMNKELVQKNEKIIS
ncbi:MAG: hypothetical protein Hyperionvirus29_34 [Hyperionvirus sp.]|uniref:Uncharacterized protein n=1 Tax=Hyperionvirus sp. TaxID=2487770 RepID=A0A3G5AE83_9VIRU|nr:MAG: hypothetical protein Hyperionvirus29_34 [Hyperionvirus sp.]